VGVAGCEARLADDLPFVYHGDGDVLPGGVRFVDLHPPAHQQKEAPPVFLQDEDLSGSQLDKGAARREALDPLLWERFQNVNQGQEPLLPLHRRALSHGANVDPKRANDPCPPTHNGPEASSSSGSSARGQGGRGRDLSSPSETNCAHTLRLYVRVSESGSELTVSIGDSRKLQHSS
jgi:hypothetical protein